jgi:hypothetical protein
MSREGVESGVGRVGDSLRRVFGRASMVASVG